MAGKLEQAKDPNDGEKLEDIGVLDVAEIVLEQEVAVEAEGGDEVDPV